MHLLCFLALAPHQDSPYLIVSNAPETVGSTPTPLPANLYKHAFKLEGGVSRTIRFFIWHRNATGAPLYFGLLLSQNVDNVKTKAVTRIRAATPDDFEELREAAVCIAKAQLYGTTDPLPTAPETLMKSEQVFWAEVADFSSSDRVESVVALIEVTLTPTEDIAVLARTVASTTNSDWGPFSAHCAEPGSHVRGFWPYSSAVCSETFLVDVGADAAGAQVALADVNGGDTVLFAKRPDDANGSSGGNKGLYGVNMTYNFRMINKTEEDVTASAYLLTRNTGFAPDFGKFWGAARLTSTAPQVIVRMVYHDDQHDRQYATLGSYKVYAHTILPSFVPGALEIAMGGAADLPINLFVRNVIYGV